MVFVIAVIITVLLIMCYLYKKCYDREKSLENYFNTTAQKQCSTLTPDIMSQSLNVLLDPTFSNVTVYNNDENPYVPGGGDIGLKKCLAECSGNCVEFGVTGIATCFPK